MSMKNQKNFFYYILLLFLYKSYLVSLDQFIGQYKRPITMLEITDTQDCYSLPYAHCVNGVFVVLSQAEKIDAIKKKVQDYTNIVLLNPKEFSIHALVDLASCEHFDITLVHDWNLLQKNPHVVGPLLALGDYLIIDVPHTFAEKFLSEEHMDKIIWSHDLPQGNQRICFQNFKTSLGKARWCMSASAQSQQPSYTIVSTFTEKKMIKGASKKVSDWVPGINLVTAVMLHVKFPNNEILRDNIKKFLQIQHNDPVIGNMIVQGKRVVLIDFNDTRRNADQEKCLKAALKLFTWIHRPKDPLATIEKYSHYVND